MASVFGHSMVAYTIARVGNNSNVKWLILFAILSSILPDLDVIAFKFGVPYEHPLGHRGFTHSILFAIIWALLLAFTIGKTKKLIWFLVVFLSTVSHGVLDAMTSGGKGVGFFIPIINDRFFFPFRKIKVSPIRIHQFFSDWGLEVMKSEFVYIILPCIIILVISLFAKRLSK